MKKNGKFWKNFPVLFLFELRILLFALKLFLNIPKNSEYFRINQKCYLLLWIHSYIVFFYKNCQWFYFYLSIFGLLEDIRKNVKISVFLFCFWLYQNRSYVNFEFTRRWSVLWNEYLSSTLILLLNMATEIEFSFIFWNFITARNLKTSNFRPWAKNSDYSFYTHFI